MKKSKMKKSDLFKQLGIALTPDDLEDATRLDKIAHEPNYKKLYIEMLQKYVKLYEEAWHGDLELLSDKNHDNYSSARQELKISGVIKGFNHG